MLQNLAISYRGLLALLVAGTLLLTAACGRRSGTPSSTPSAPPSQASLNKADAEWIDPRRLVAEPAAYRNRHLALYGKAVTVEQRGDYTWVDLLAQPAGGTRT